MGGRLPLAALATFVVALLAVLIAAWPGLADALLRFDEQLYLTLRGSGPRPPGPPDLVEIVRDFTALGGYTVAGLVTAVYLLMLLGVHWPSDGVAGWTPGLLWVLCAQAPVETSGRGEVD